MIKVRDSSLIKYKDAHLYLDDVKNLIAIFEANFDEVKVIVDGYQITDFSKLSDLKKPFATELTIEGSPDYGEKDYKKGNMTLTLKKYKIDLYISDADNVAFLGVASKIKEIIDRRKSPLRFFDRGWMLAMLIILGEILSVLCYKLLHFPETAYYPLTFGVSLLIGLVWILFSIQYFRRPVRIYLFEFYTRTNFFKRKKDDLLVGILVGLIGAVAGSVLTVIIEHLANPKP